MAQTSGKPAHLGAHRKWIRRVVEFFDNVYDDSIESGASPSLVRVCCDSYVVMRGASGARLDAAISGSSTKSHWYEPGTVRLLLHRLLRRASTFRRRARREPIRLSFGYVWRPPELSGRTAGSDATQRRGWCCRRRWRSVLVCVATVGWPARNRDMFGGSRQFLPRPHGCRCQSVRCFPRCGWLASC